MTEEKHNQRLTISMESANNWKIKNRFLGFWVLLFLAFACLIAPQGVEDALNRK